MKKFISFIFECFTIAHPRLVFAIAFFRYKRLLPGSPPRIKIFLFLCDLSKRLKDVMLAEKIFRATPDDSAEEKEADALRISFW
ncbi:MAG: hypothetical protein WC456_02720 [Patescibacteria group bacterium]